METFKELWIKFWKNVWETVKSSFVSLLMYFGVSSIVFMSTFSGELSQGMTGTRAAWVFGGIAVALAYNAFTMFAFGGQGYEMLVSGNMKRIASGGMKISTHKEEKEYRPWRGFVCGAIISIFIVLSGILMGANQSVVDQAMISAKDEIDMATGLIVMVFIIFLLSGWSVMPFFFLNMGGASVSYYWSCLFGILPILVGGIFYIVGAYGKRAKAIKAQELADKASKAQMEKPKKINYGGLPGTKPKKKK